MIVNFNNSYIFTGNYLYNYILILQFIYVHIAQLHL